MKTVSFFAAGVALVFPMLVTAQAPTLYSGGGCSLEYEYDCIDYTAEIDPLAEEVIDIIESSLDRNFVATANVAVDVEGVEYNYDDTYTDYSINYSAENFAVKKNENAYHIDIDGESLSLLVDGTTSPSYMLPVEFDITWNEEAVLDFDTFQFAGRFDIESVDTHGNESFSHLVDGVLEIVELFENKWIVLDFEEIENSFPDLAEAVQEMKDDFMYEFESSDVNNAYEMLRWGLSEAILYGLATVEKSGNQYTITISDQHADEPSSITIILSTTRGGNISNLEVLGSVTDYDYWDEASFMTVSPVVNVDFTYTTPSVVFPEITEDDWEVTNIVEMFLEFAKDDILEEQEELKYFENLESFQGTAEDAIVFLNENGTDTDRAFVAEYVEQAKVFDRRIRKKDIQLAADYYTWSDDWTVGAVYRELMYSPYDDSEYRYYNQKYAIEYMMEILDPNRFEYGSYIPWDYYERSSLQLQSRGDILILFAKMKKSEMMLSQ